MILMQSDETNLGRHTLEGIGFDHTLEGMETYSFWKFIEGMKHIC